MGNPDDPDKDEPELIEEEVAPAPELKDTEPSIDLLKVSNLNELAISLGLPQTPEESQLRQKAVEAITTGASPEDSKEAVDRYEEYIHGHCFFSTETKKEIMASLALASLWHETKHDENLKKCLRVAYEMADQAYLDEEAEAIYRLASDLLGNSES